MNKKKVLIINSNIELIEALSDVLKSEGFHICTEQTADIKAKKPSYDDLLKTCRPDVVLYDIAIPYQENWELFKRMVSSKEGRKYPHVLTTTNKVVLEKLVGPTHAHLVIGKPFDLAEILDAVKHAATKNAS